MVRIQIDAPNPIKESEKQKAEKKSGTKTKMDIRLWPLFSRSFNFCTILIILAALNVATAADADAEPTNPHDYFLPKSNSTLYSFKHGAVSSDSKICSEIGTKILKHGGNVADAAIATLLCNGIATMQSLGLGGGSVMNIFIGGKAYTLNAKDVAPINLKNESFRTSDDYQYGSLAIGTPGEVKGYWELHKRFGSMKWKELFQPTIELCERGTELTEHMHYGLELQPFNITDPYLRKTFFNSTTNEIYPIGTHIYPPRQLCDTYKYIAEDGGQDFYTGHLADLVAEDLKDIGSVITKQDLQEYKTIWSDSIPVQLDNHTLYVTPAPTGGGIVALILNILKGYKFSPDSIATEEKQLLTYHRIIETFKFAFGQRSKIGDPEFVPIAEIYKNLTSMDYAEILRQQIDDDKTYTDALHYGAEYGTSVDRGTSHMSIMASNGDAIAVTSSINYYFGCGHAGKRTGIVFNTGIGDFGVPPFKNDFGMTASPANYLAPKKRALSSMCPIILTNENNTAELVLGAAGGVRIIPGVSWTIMRTLWFQQNVKEAVDSLRLNHQLEPMRVEYELGTSQTLLDGLHKLGHSTFLMLERGAIVNAIYRNQSGIYANADFRKKGDAAGF